MKDLNGIRGWLTFYLVTRGFGWSLVLTGTILKYWYELGPVLLLPCFWLALNLTGVYLILKRKDSISRIYHILYNGFIAGFCIFLLFGNLSYSSTNMAIYFVISYGIWCLYWVVSKRVEATYPNIQKATTALEG